MPTTQASPAVGATRPLRRRAATEEGRDFTPNAVSKRVRAKKSALTSYHKRIFRSAVKVKPFGRASATLTEIEYPLLVKRVFTIPLPPPYAAKPPDGHRRRCESAMPTTQASPAVGDAPAGRRAAMGGRDSHQRSLQEGKGKTDALTLLSSVFFGVLSRSSPSGAQARP